MDPFVLRVVVSFVLGGLTVALFTAAAERLGSRVGGLLLSFPVKVGISMLFIGLNEGAHVASAAATAIPLGLGVNVVFLAGCAFFVRRLAPWPAIHAALALWLVAGLLAVLVVPAALPWNALAWLVTAGASLALLPRTRGATPRKRGSEQFGVLGLLTRAAGAGTIVALSLVAARYGGPLLGGLASVFPSGWITTMVILTRHHGPDYTAQTVRVMIAGSIAPVLFGYAVWLAFPALGVWLGMGIAIGVALVTSLAVAALLRWSSAR